MGSERRARRRRSTTAPPRVTVNAALPVVGATYTMTYTIHGDGEIHRGVQLQARDRKARDDAALRQRAGGGARLENITWYGRGPQETMIDRNFERIGVYSSTVDKEWVEYMRPQENGNKTDVRWVKLTNADGIGLMAIGRGPAERHRAALHRRKTWSGPRTRSR